MIGLSFKYLTQDNYLEKKATFFGVKSFQENTRNCHKIPVLTPGMRDKTCYGTKKVTTQKSLAGRSPNFRIQTLDRGGSCQSRAVTVWSCGRGASQSWLVPRCHSMRGSPGGAGGCGQGLIPAISSAPEECYQQPSACSLKFITI